MNQTEFRIDFIGIGAARCGTTWLADCLREHPQIFLPKIKELHYFNRPDRYREDLKGFREFFPPQSVDQIRGEFTPRYLISIAALQRIKYHFPGVKLIISLRNPITRAYSQYRYFRYNKLREGRADFEKAMLDPRHHEDYIEKGLYAGKLKTVFELFKRSRVLVLFFEDITENPESVLKTMCQFLEVDPEFSPPSAARLANVGKRGDVGPPRWLANMVDASLHNKFSSPRIVRLCQQTAKLGITCCSIFSGCQDSAPTGDCLSRLYDKFFAEDAKRTGDLLGKDLHGIWKSQLASP